MRILLFLAFSSAAFATSGHGLLGAIEEHTGSLHPISIHDFRAATGLQRRSTVDFSHLDLHIQSELIYGGATDAGDFLLANMTLYAPDGLQMVLMEEFEHLTSSVDCKGDDGIMSLTFKSRQAFDYALETWRYINKYENSRFILIANHEGCGPDDERQPYLITGITEETSTLTTYLTAHTAPWSEIAGTYDLDFGKPIPYQRSHQSVKRGLWGDIKDVGKDIGDVFTGSADLSKSVFISVSTGHASVESTIFEDEEAGFTLDCVNCFIAGGFEVIGHISIQDFTLKDLTLSASPSNLLATLELGLTVTDSSSPKSLGLTKELFSFPIPDCGVAVPGIFKLGATLSYSIGVSTTFSGSTTVNFGLQASLPNSAHLVADIENPEQSSAGGFEPDLTPLFEVEALSADVEVAAFSQPKLAFGIELTGVGDVDVALVMKLPEVKATLSAEYDSAGLCDHIPGASKTGVKIDSSIDVSLDLELEATLGDESENSTLPAWSQSLWEKSRPLVSLCLPLDIPGLSNSTATISSHASSSKRPSATSHSSRSSIATMSRSGGASVSMSSSRMISPSPRSSRSPGGSNNLHGGTAVSSTMTVSSFATSTSVFKSGVSILSSVTSSTSSTNFDSFPSQGSLAPLSSILGPSSSGQAIMTSFERQHSVSPSSVAATLPAGASPMSRSGHKSQYLPQTLQQSHDSLSSSATLSKTSTTRPSSVLKSISVKSSSSDLGLSQPQSDMFSSSDNVKPTLRTSSQKLSLKLDTTTYLASSAEDEYTAKSTTSAILSVPPSLSHSQIKPTIKPAPTSISKGKAAPPSRSPSPLTMKKHSKPLPPSTLIQVHNPSIPSSRSPARPSPPLEEEKERYAPMKTPAPIKALGEDAPSFPKKTSTTTSATTTSSIEAADPTEPVSKAVKGGGGGGGGECKKVKMKMGKRMLVC